MAASDHYNIPIFQIRMCIKFLHMSNTESKKYACRNNNLSTGWNLTLILQTGLRFSKLWYLFMGELCK